MIARLLLALIVSFTVAAKAADKAAHTDLAAVHALSDTLATASDVQLLEGLPHQAWEKDALAAELKSKKTVEVQKFPFYATPMPLTDAQRAELKTILSKHDAYAPYAGEKRCGGFHPDFCLTWKNGDVPVHLMICFGCGEFRITSGETAVTTSMGTVAGQQLHASFLKDYRIDRPAR